MKIHRVLSFLASALVVVVALAGPAGAGPARSNDGSDGPSRIDADGFADELLDGRGEVAPPPPFPSTTWPPPPPPEDPFDRPTAPGGEVVLDPGPRSGDGDSTDPADPDATGSDDGSTEPPSGGGRGRTGGATQSGLSRRANDARSDNAQPSSDDDDEEAAAETDAPEDADDGTLLALTAVLGVVMLGVGALVAMVRRNA